MNLQPLKTNEATGRAWRIKDLDTDSFVDGPPERFNHPDLGWTTISGIRFFQRKKDAQAAIDRITAGLADGTLRWKDHA